MRPKARTEVDRPHAPCRPARSWADLPLDQTLALTSAVARLADQFADRATVPTFLPLMAERFARQRLRALAKVEGLHDDGKPTVLFLCTHNAGRSQMALGFFTHLAGAAAVAWSGGSEPGVRVSPAAGRPVRDEIERRVRALLDELGVPVGVGR